MSRRQIQFNRAKLIKFQAQERLKKALIPWMREIILSYRPGSTIVNQESKDLLFQILLKFYNGTAKQVLRFDPRQYKQEEEELSRVVRVNISQELGAFFTSRAANMSEEISKTSSKWVQRTSLLSVENQWTPPESRKVLTNYLNNQRLVISVTEAQTAVETTRGTAVLSVNDPLKNTMTEMIRLIRAGDYNAANRLSRQVIGLAKLPTSVSQGQLIDFINDNRDRLLVPRFQAQMLQRIIVRAEKLDKNLKKWQTIGDAKVRISHDIAGQQPPIEVTEAFQLPGGALQWPGDATLGAALFEIIR